MEFAKQTVRPVEWVFDAITESGFAATTGIPARMMTR
jgi:hypothetical protein